VAGLGSGIAITLTAACAVDLLADGVAFTFVNTHLEVEGFASVQQGQAQNLFDALAPVSGQVILAGDFNSAPTVRPPLLSHGHADVQRCLAQAEYNRSRLHLLHRHQRRRAHADGTD